jgi:hypothetical protein
MHANREFSLVVDEKEKKNKQLTKTTIKKQKRKEIE